MNERDFKAKLRKHLKPYVHIQSISSLGVSGTPDLWISGKGGDLWIEVKYDERTPLVKTPKLSALQTKWLNDRFHEGREVLVIVGTSPDEGIIYKNLAWESASHHRVSFEEIITTILGYVI